MARTRLVKPALFENEILGELEPIVTLAFIGLWQLADRDGYLEDRPKRIKAQIFPYRHCDIEQILSDLADNEFITRYAVDSKNYIYINGFSEHQTPHMNEKASGIPQLHQSSTVQAPDKHSANPSVTCNIEHVTCSSSNPLSGTTPLQVFISDTWNKTFNGKLTPANGFSRAMEKNLQQLITQHPELASQQWWQEFLPQLSDSKYLMGETGNRGGAKLSWVLSKTKDGDYYLNKILAGDYHD